MTHACRLLFATVLVRGLCSFVRPNGIRAEGATLPPSRPLSLSVWVLWSRQLAPLFPSRQRDGHRSRTEEPPLCTGISKKSFDCQGQKGSSDALRGKKDPRTASGWRKKELREPMEIRASTESGPCVFPHLHCPPGGQTSAATSSPGAAIFQSHEGPSSWALSWERQRVTRLGRAPPASQSLWRKVASPFLPRG